MTSTRVFDLAIHLLPKFSELRDVLLCNFNDFAHFGCLHAAHRIPAIGDERAAVSKLHNNAPIAHESVTYPHNNPSAIRFQSATTRAEQALAAIDRAGSGALVLCGIVYAELCACPGDATRIAEELRAAGVAGSGTPRRIIADFVIGAHASRVGTLVSDDAAFYLRAFPNLRVIDVRG
ncbi:MAG: type II toxin-antitoxin system VapC family toxin [Vulcanimicrobiaceae bacterium]